ncbi:MAG: hypothetical protein QM820_11285 [Minicystis sp.]
MTPASSRLVHKLGLLAGAAGAIIAAAVASCTLLIETRTSQCESNADCAHFPNAACDTAQHLCVDKECAGGQCVCNPETPTDILNGCPKGECSPFDNTRVPGLGPDGGLPEPMGGGAAPDPTYDCSTGGSGTGGSAPTLPTCEDQPAPLYIVGPDSIKPLLAWVAELFAKEGGRTVVFQANSSCTAVGIMYDTTKVLEHGMTSFKTWYYDAAGKEHLCSIQKDTIRPDIGLSDVFPQTCGYNTTGSDQTVIDTPGPVQAFGFVVPKDPASKQTSISAEAAYMVYGFGAENAKVEPWTDTRYIFQRSKSSGTQQMIATALGLDPGSFHATTNNGSDHEALLLGCSPEKDKTLGVLAVDIVQKGDHPIRLLAYQHYKQDCAYYPDTDESSNDKRHVRDGHYFIWGPIHMLTRTTPADMEATRLINYVSGIVPPPADEPVDIFQVWSEAHLVPQCAMHVTRTSDGGPLSKYAPHYPCYCKYDEVTAGSSDCPKCKTAADCPSERPTCNLGYCELAGSPE